MGVRLGPGWYVRWRRWVHARARVEFLRGDCQRWSYSPGAVGSPFELAFVRLQLVETVWGISRGEAEVFEDAWPMCPQNHRPGVKESVAEGVWQPGIWRVTCPGCRSWIGASSSRDDAFRVAHEHVANVYGGAS